MSSLSKITDSIKDEINSTPAVEEKVETIEETSPKTEAEEPAQSVAEEPAAEPVETPAEVEPVKPNLNELTDLQKAEHSFKKQMNRQRSKYESDLAELRKQIDELKKPKPEQKFRDNFENDDQYIDYIVKQRLDSMMKERDEADEKRRAEQAENDKRAAAIDENINACFNTEESRKDYITTVQKAFDDGLEDLMNQEQYVSNYIMNSKNGPKILYEMAKNPELVNKIYSQPDPMSRLLEVKLYERDLNNAPAAPVTPAPVAPAPVTPAPVTPAPVAVSAPIGKPGTSTPTTSDIFSDKNAMRNFLRRR